LIQIIININKDKKNASRQQTVAKMRVAEGFRAVRPASGFSTGDTDAAPQSLTAHGLDR